MTTPPAADSSELPSGCARAGVVITRVQLETWTDRRMTPALLARLADTLQHSFVPEAIANIIEGFTD